MRLDDFSDQIVMKHSVASCLLENMSNLIYGKVPRISCRRDDTTTYLSSIFEA